LTKNIPRRPCKLEKDTPPRRANKIMRFICSSLHAKPIAHLCSSRDLELINRKRPEVGASGL